MILNKGWIEINSFFIFYLLNIKLIFVQLIKSIIMNYTVETYKDLLNEEEYGDQFIEEFKTVKELIGVSNPEELTVTTSEDVENEEEFNKFVEFISKLCSLDKIKEVVLDFDVLTLVEIEGINLIYYSNQIDVIILKVSDKEKFEQIFSQS